jgi:hypothetical protein
MAARVSRAPAAAGGRHDHGRSGSYSLTHDPETEGGQRQGHWFSALNHVDADRGPGRRSAGRQHNPGREYIIPSSSSSVPGQQSFRWCRKCECLLLGDNHPSCAAGAHETSGSGQYLGPTNPKPL